ncbi:MAG: MFS transporter [Alphaproteobacteria bacterium]
MTSNHTSAGPKRRSGARALLRDRGYLAFWIAGGLIGVVRWLQLLALGVYTFETTGSPFLVSLIPLFFMAPMALTGPLWGAVADRIDRKRLFMATATAVGGISAVMAYIAHVGALGFGHVAVASLLAGVFWATDLPIRRRLIGDLSGDAIAAAMSLDAATGNATRMLGPLLGGLTLQYLGVAGVFLFSAAIYALGILFAARVQTPAGECRQTAPTSFVHDLASGVRLVANHAWLKLVLSVTIVFNVFGFAFTSMIPVVGARQLALDAFWVGVLSSLEGLGAFLGAILVATIARPDNHFRIYFRGVAVYLTLIGALALAAFNVDGLPAPFLIVGAILLAIGVAGACFSAMQSTLTYLAAPPGYRSRVLGVLTLCIGMAPLGFLCIGWIADDWGAPTALAGTSLAGLVALILVRVRYRAAGSSSIRAESD